MKKTLKNIAGSVIATTIVVMIINIITNGMFLLGTPKIDEVEKIIVWYPNVTEERKEFTDSENIELGCKLLNFLNYVPVEKPDKNDIPLITMTYILEDGTSVSAAANNEMVWWNGKVHVLKEKGAFVKLAEGIFYFEELAQER